MTTKALTRNGGTLPAVFDDFFKPWNEWFDNRNSLWNRILTVPAVNITETKDEYKLSIAAPGMKKDDFDIAVDGNMLTISSEKETNKEEKDENFTRKEFNYSSFNRSFSLPDEINKEDIQASYHDGLLLLVLPKRDDVKKKTSKHISIK